MFQKSLVGFLGIFTLLHFVFLPLDATPTERYLEVYSIEQLLEVVDPNIKDNLSSLIDISKGETEDTFFAYHAITQNSRLFQDILRVVFEEVLDYQLPEDFYFLRIPGDPLLSGDPGCRSFLERFGEKNITQEYKEAVIKNFLAIIQKNCGDSIAIDAFSSVEQERLWFFFDSFINYYNRYLWNQMARKYALPEDYPIHHPEFNQLVSDAIEIVTSKYHVLYPDKDTEAVRAWMSKKFSDFYDVYLVFNQRELPLEDRIDPNLIDQLAEPYDDTKPLQQFLLVSLNLSIFGNPTSTGSFSPGIYLSNTSMLGGDEFLENSLRSFFDEIGLDSSLASSMWLAGLEMLKDVPVDGGSILQFFDISAAEHKTPFSFVDENAYVSFVYGVPVPELIPSEYIQGKYFLRKGVRDLEMRLVMNNKTTLNPYSTLRMIRHDRLPAGFSQNLLGMLKSMLKETPKDAEKITIYHEKLQEYWELAPAA